MIAVTLLGRSLVHDYPGPLRAVDGVDLALDAGETLGLVGESGSGKTTLGRAILRLVPLYAGRIRFMGHDLHALSPRRMRPLRRRMQVIFQDPGGSLDARMRVGDLVGEPLLVHGLLRGAVLRRRVGEWLERCGLSAADADKHPHEFSGGQRQRIAIARALTLEPALLVCDEPTSSLDVSVQAEIFNLLSDLREDLGMASLFISHDIGVIAHSCQRIAVVLAGRIVEHGDRDAILDTPQDPYTRQLIDAAGKTQTAMGAAMRGCGS